MSATFDASLPTARDRVRFLLGDVPEGASSGTISDALIQDETIDAMLAQASYTETCRQMAISLLSRYSSEPDRYEEGNGLKLHWQNRLDGWKAVLKELKDTAPATVPRSGIAAGLLTAPAMTNMRTD